MLTLCNLKRVQYVLEKERCFRQLLEDKTITSHGVFSNFSIALLRHLKDRSPSSMTKVQIMAAAMSLREKGTDFSKPPLEIPEVKSRSTTVVLPPAGNDETAEMALAKALRRAESCEEKLLVEIDALAKALTEVKKEKARCKKALAIVKPKKKPHQVSSAGRGEH